LDKSHLYLLLLNLWAGGLLQRKNKREQHKNTGPFYKDNNIELADGLLTNKN